jgi:hypothetical protein
MSAMGVGPHGAYALATASASVVDISPEFWREAPVGAFVNGISTRTHYVNIAEGDALRQIFRKVNRFPTPMSASVKCVAVTCPASTLIKDIDRNCQASKQKICADSRGRECDPPAASHPSLADALSNGSPCPTR